MINVNLFCSLHLILLGSALDVGLKLSWWIYYENIADVCPDDFIKCASNGECVSKNVTCDGRMNCLDGTDEIEHCGEYFFKHTKLSEISNRLSG